MDSNKIIPHSFPSISDYDINTVIKVLKGGRLDDGDAVTDLENEFKRLYNSSYAVAVSSGFAAIHLSLVSLKIKSGDEVIIPSYACAALLNPIILLGATPIVADIDENSFNISIQSIKQKLTIYTKAIIVPHTFGFPARIDEIIELGIPVIEDCAQSIGGLYKDKLLGQYGALSIFSFYASKMICGGDGGMILTNDEELYKTLINYRYYGHKKLHRYVAYNYHLTNLPASIAHSQIMQLNQFIIKRKHLAAIYDNHFLNKKKIHVLFENKEHSCYYRYPVSIDNDIDEIKQLMRNANILCGYGVLEGMHQMLNIDDKNYPYTTKKLNTILSIPIYPTLKESEAIYIANKLNYILNN